MIEKYIHYPVSLNYDWKIYSLSDFIKLWLNGGAILRSRVDYDHL